MGMQYPQRCVDSAIRYTNLTHSNNTEWDMTFYYNLEDLGGSCPVNSSGFPMCSCNDGYEGDLFFDENSLSWIGSCIESIVDVDDPVDDESDSVDDESNNSTEANDSIPLDEDNEVPGFGFMTVSVSLLVISFFRRRK